MNVRLSAVQRESVTRSESGSSAANPDSDSGTSWHGCRAAGLAGGQDRMRGSRPVRRTWCGCLVPARFSGAWAGMERVDGRRAACAKPVVRPRVSRMWPVESTTHSTLSEPCRCLRTVVLGLERERQRGLVRWECPASPVRCRRLCSPGGFASSQSAGDRIALTGRNQCTVPLVTTDPD